MKSFLKNVCLIGFALVGPITLPAGGIQRNLNEDKVPQNAKQIILPSNYSLYTFPKSNAKELISLNSGSTVSILQRWVGYDKERWLRVELASNCLFDNPTKVRKGWLKI